MLGRVVKIAALHRKKWVGEVGGLKRYLHRMDPWSVSLG